MSLSGDTTQSSLSAPALLVPLNSSASPHSLPWVRPSHPTPQLREEWPKNDTRLLANLSLLSPHDDCHMSPILTACLVVWYSVTMVLGLVGNIANVTSIFICNLSFSDILVCVFCLPFTVIYTLMDHWVFGALMCRLVPFIQCVSVTVSVLSLVFIALERHQLIINPSGWKPSIPQAYIAVILIWILLSNEPYTNVPIPKSSLRTQDSAETYNHWPSPKQRLAYTTWLLVFQYCGPLLLVLLCYVRVFVRLRHRKDMLDRVRTPESQRVTHSRRINIMLVALITAFALCWLPLTIFNVLSDWKQEALPVCHHNLLFSLCHLLAMSSTCINPIIYGFLNSNFRQEVRDVILHCRWRPVEESEHYPMSTVQMEMSRSSMPQNFRLCFVKQHFNTITITVRA
uniref:G-protein coupled receptors family 1 profile domain-containing protein n=1 Tax=Periophthalmus magnuspinnatus TaxID=409849 RepID=A0A3B4BJR5_9GOBI